MFLGLIAVFRHWLGGTAEIAGMPHPYWLPVLLASAQYGISGGVIATIAASSLYFLEAAPQSAVQDFYDHAGAVAVQPAAWLATTLIIGGLRSLHLHQTAELAERVTAGEQREHDLSDGLKRAAAAIDALERRIASDMSSIDALSRSLSLIDLSDRARAAVSCGEVFHAAAGAATFTLYLRTGDAYVPACAFEDNVSRATISLAPLTATALDAMTAEASEWLASGEAAADAPRSLRHVVHVPPAHTGADAVAAIVCPMTAAQDATRFRRRADELSRAFAMLLQACPEQTAEGR